MESIEQKIKIASLLKQKSYHDPANNISFIGATNDYKTESFDKRTNEQLLKDALTLPDSLERERAMWEYCLRENDDALEKINLFFQNEKDKKVKWNLLWLAVTAAGKEATPLLNLALKAEESEVRDWARVYLEELTGKEYGMEYSSAVYRDDRTFDQTIPLQIAGYADVNVPGVGWVQAKLSPRWFDSILGRVLACTNTDTFMTNLVIEKEIKNYNTDGSHHYEPFIFRGVSYSIDKYLTKHIYESNTTRPFYPSGKVKEGEKPHLLAVSLDRVAVTCKAYPQEAGITLSTEQGTMTERGSKLMSEGFVRSVRGRFKGWAYTDLSRFMETGTIEPGTVQLTNTTDPVNGHLTNTVVYGTFRGKAGDYNGDGKIDINEVPCHATVEGLLDLNLDGEADRDPFVPSTEVDYR